MYYVKDFNEDSYGYQRLQRNLMSGVIGDEIIPAGGFLAGSHHLNPYQEGLLQYKIYLSKIIHLAKSHSSYPLIVPKNYKQHQ